MATPLSSLLYPGGQESPFDRLKKYIDDQLRIVHGQINAASQAGGSVSSVFGRSGTVTAQTGDYTFSQIGSRPASLAGYGITDPVVLTTGSYSDPSWITTLSWSKILSTPTTVAGYGITDAITLTGTQVLTNKDLTSGTNVFPTFNQSTTGSAAKWTTARTLAGNSVDGSTNVSFSNKFIVQGTTDSGLSAAQFLGALGTGILKNTTTTGVLSIAVAGTDYQSPITLTTIGTSGAATFVSGTLNIPSYAGGVSTVSNSDTTLTISPTSGAVVASLNLASANTWTGKITVNPSVTASSAIAQGTIVTPSLTAAVNSDVLVGMDLTPVFVPGSFTSVSKIGQRITLDSLATTTTEALYLRNSIASTSSVTAQYSPSVTWEGHGWKSNATAADQIIKFRAYNAVSTSALNAVASWNLESSSNGGAFTSRMTVTDSAIAAQFNNSGLQIVSGGISFSGTAASASRFRIGGAFIFEDTSTVSTANTTVWSWITGSAAPASGATVHHSMAISFAPTSGTATYTNISLTDTINQTGGASGTTTSINIAPTITAAADYRAIQTSVTAQGATAVPLVLNQGSVLRTTVLNGAVESTTHMYYSTGGVRYQLDQGWIISQTTAINAKTVANTTLYTVPTGKTLIVSALIVRCTAASAITNGPTVNVFTVSAGDVYPSTAINALTGTSNIFGFGTIGMSISVAAGATLSLGLTVVSTGTSQTIAVDVMGYLV